MPWWRLSCPRILPYGNIDGSSRRTTSPCIHRCLNLTASSMHEWLLAQNEVGPSAFVACIKPLTQGGTGTNINKHSTHTILCLPLDASDGHSQREENNKLLLIHKLKHTEQRHPIHKLIQPVCPQPLPPLPNERNQLMMLINKGKARQTKTSVGQSETKHPDSSRCSHSPTRSL